MKVKTAQGKTLDMGALIAKNEKARAVGNMKVNARGDTIDSHNNIIKSVNEKTASGYAKTVGNKSGQIVRQTPLSNNQSTMHTINQLPVKPINDEEQNLLQDLQEFIEDDKDLKKETNEKEKNDSKEI